MNNAIPMDQMIQAAAQIANIIGPGVAILAGIAFGIRMVRFLYLATHEIAQLTDGEKSKPPDGEYSLPLEVKQKSKRKAVLGDDGEFVYQSLDDVEMSTDSPIGRHIQ